MAAKINSEADLSGVVVDFLRRFGDVTKVESPSTSAGVPDLNFCNSSVHEWIELKCMKPGENNIGIRPTQYKWFRDRVKAGGKPVMLVFVSPGNLYYLVQGADVTGGDRPLRYRAQLVTRASLVADNLECVLAGFVGRPTSGS